MTKRKVEKAPMTESVGKTELAVDEDSCISCGTCYGMAPDLFESDDEGKSKVKKQPKSPEEIELAKEAINSCPSQAISY